MLNARNFLGAALGGIAGCVANSIAVAIVLGAPLIGLIFSPGRQFFSILFAMALIPIFAKISGAAAWIIGVVVLVALGAGSVKWGFGSQLGWSYVLPLNGVYAIAAIAVYVLVAKPRALAA